jgi:hypothetical protein
MPEAADSFLNNPLVISPGRLLRLGEACCIVAESAGTLTLKKRSGPGFSERARASLHGGEEWNWTPDECGFYLAEFSDGTETVQRSIGVVAEGWAVCQVTIGAMVGEDQAGTIHPAGLSADYYVELGRNDRPADFTLRDERWKRYERQFGDAIYPHVMADLGQIDSALSAPDPNWDSLPPEGIRARLTRLQEWCRERGYRPLNRIASYTPSNALVEACGETGMRILHSLIPEQNWSDGEWAINHWGMPNCPFWISAEDFRKPGRRHDKSVLGIAMNHYHVVLPHLTHWGDFVLSPSHFARWIRSAEPGDEPVRFRQFLEDTVGGWRSFGGHPFFFVAGFEFGRTFGTKVMTTHNRRGLESLIALAGDQPLVFATGPDVLAYYQRHLEHFPESVFRQRDSWAGVTVNHKPALVPDALIVERNAYKAALIEGEASPYFYYDYTVPWKFATRDEDAPHDFAEDCRRELAVTRAPDRLTLEAAAPLTRTVPVAIWDAAPENPPWPTTQLPLLEDGREVFLLEVPAGWSGKTGIVLRRSKTVPAVRHLDGWKIQTFGIAEKKHSYLILDRPVIEEVTVPVRLRRTARIEGAIDLPGMREAGVVPLIFGPLKRWYRFWGCDAADIEPPSLAPGDAISRALLPADGAERFAAHAAELRAAALKRLGCTEADLKLEVLCGGNLLHGTRSRAAASDRTFSPEGRFDAREFVDGAISFGPGRSFWYHPRNLHAKIYTKIPAGGRISRPAQQLRSAGAGRRLRRARGQAQAGPLATARLALRRGSVVRFRPGGGRFQRARGGRVRPGHRPGAGAGPVVAGSGLYRRAARAVDCARVGCPREALQPA